MPSILLINPNSSTAITTCILRSAKSPSGVDVSTFQAPPSAPPSIDDTVTSILSAASCWDGLLPLLHSFDAFLVACYSDHPLVHMLREKTTRPVMGILEASVTYALRTGHKFGVVTTGVGWITPLTRAILHELTAVDASPERFAQVVATGLGVLEFHEEGEEKARAVNVAVGRAASQFVQDSNVDIIILGCAGMEGLEEAVIQGVKEGGKEVRVVDGVWAGVFLLSEKLKGI